MKTSPEKISEFLRSRNRKEIHRDDLKQAGVLLLLFPKNGELHVLLTKRSSGVEHHKGQVSLPGGSVDQNDRDIVSTAVRETEEEVGVSAESIRVLGVFDDVWTPSGFRITPVVGYSDPPRTMRFSPLEVEEVIEVPLSFFLDERNERVQKFVRNGEAMDVYFYRYGDTEIWGATAAMIRSFLHSLKENGLVG